MSNTLEQLSRPFDVADLKFRAMAWSKDGSSALAFAYIDSRLVMERLDEIFGGDWSYEVDVVPNDTRAVVIATIISGENSRTVQGIGEADIHINEKGNYANDPWKSAESDAIKRAAVALGIGRYLYSLPQVWVPWEGDKFYGKFTANPADYMFGEVEQDVDNKPEPPKRGAGRPKAPSVPAPNKPTAPAPKAPAANKPAVAAPPSGGRQSQQSTNADACQVEWLEGVYDAAGEMFPNFSEWTRTQASEHIRECIEAGGNDNAPTIPQLEVMSKMCDQLEEGLPENLAELTKATASQVIQKMTKAIAANK